ncbi:hypothetical protein, partial [Candidatus Methylomirabilis sp.]|uniref:hypothetical protein n=1 Tax=Candidatus Methylomirabilis sp. TaxID=2032687 RepID=UPI003C713E56
AATRAANYVQRDRNRSGTGTKKLRAPPPPGEARSDSATANPGCFGRSWVPSRPQRMIQNPLLDLRNLFSQRYSCR